MKPKNKRIHPVRYLMTGFIIVIGLVTIIGSGGGGGDGDDDNPPNTSIASGPGNLTNSTSASFDFTSTELGSTFQCSLDGGAFANCISPINYAGLAEGDHSFSVEATDAANNSDPTPATYTWAVDLTSPNTNITSAPANPTNSTNNSFVFNTTETGSTFQCSLDSGAFANCTSPINYAGLAEGDHSFSVEATDAANNSDPTPATHNWTIDLTSPTVVFVKPTDGELDALRNDSLEITFDEPINCSTVDNATISLNPVVTGAVSCGDSKITFIPAEPLNSDTLYSVAVNAPVDDLAGNPISTFPNWSFSTGTATAWARQFISGYSRIGNTVQTADNGYFMVGYGSGFNNWYTYWIMKTDEIGQPIWERYTNSFAGDFAQSGMQTDDDGFMVAGYSWDGTAGSQDALIMKLDANGLPEWQRAYGAAASAQRPYAIIPVSSGGYISVGEWSYSGGHDVWILRLDNAGNVIWQRRYGPIGSGEVRSIQETSDGGYVFAGYRELTEISSDFWVMKLDSDGDILWSPTFGNLYIPDSASAIRQTSDGGYIVVGRTESFGAGSSDAWIVKLSSTGSVEWQNTYGGSASDSATDVRQTEDGGYVVVGQTNSFGVGGSDVWVLKLTNNGVVEWQKTYGRSSTDEIAKSIELTTDGGYVIGGESNSTWWILKIGTNGKINFNMASEFQHTVTTISAVPSNNIPGAAGTVVTVSTAQMRIVSVPLASGSSIMKQQAP